MSATWFIAGLLVGALLGGMVVGLFTIDVVVVDSDNVTRSVVAS